jgi:hypothetical protein
MNLGIAATKTLAELEFGGFLLLVTLLVHVKHFNINQSMLAIKKLISISINLDKREFKKK